ncbi:MAG: CPBP family intramembrane metalloprotease [Lachnospiraceae bacterium]|nr:CPBP family intramembrane metalloprotease [Lachnospiraceae bacterium]
MRKNRAYLLGLLPVLILVIVQIASSIAVTGWGMAWFLNVADVKKGDSFFVQFSDFINNSGIMDYVYLLYSFLGLLIMGLWIRSLKKKGSLGVSFKIQALRGGMVPLLILLAVSLQLVTDYVMQLSMVLLPEAGEKYSKLMEDAHLAGGQTSMIMIVYACVLGPILEELAFRGITFRYARMSFNFWIANIFQAVLFGAFHMNVIQGIYAGLLGLVLGYLFEKSGNLTICILVHMFFNSLSGMISMVLGYTYEIPILFGAVLLVSMIATYFCLYMFTKMVSSWKGSNVDTTV